MYTGMRKDNLGEYWFKNNGVYGYSSKELYILSEKLKVTPSEIVETLEDYLIHKTTNELFYKIALLIHSTKKSKKEVVNSWRLWKELDIT